MSTRDLSECLRSVELHLASAARSLSDFGSPAAEWIERLERAAGRIQEIASMRPSNAELLANEAMLRKIARQATVLQTLLDSAAAIHFGRVLSCCAFNSGYLPGGAAEVIGGGCLQVRG